MKHSCVPFFLIYFYFYFLNVLMHFLSYSAEHVKGIHTFGRCMLLTCQVSMVRVQAVWENWELAREIRDGEEATISQICWEEKERYCQLSRRNKTI